MNNIDIEVIEGFLDFAQLQAVANNDWGEGFWIGRAIQHADQNAIDHEWLVGAFELRGLDVAVIPNPKPGDPEPALN